MDLRPFDPDHRCPKCGHAPADVTHRNEVVEGDTNIIGQRLDPHPEMLALHCLRCDYGWDTQTADSEANAD